MPGLRDDLRAQRQEFIAHINRCESLQGKMILKDDYDNLAVKDDDMNAKSVKL